MSGEHRAKELLFSSEDTDFYDRNRYRYGWGTTWNGWPSREDDEEARRRGLAE